MKNALPQKIGVIGAGTMGAAIAQHFVMKGLDVTLLDVKPEYVERGKAIIAKSLEEAEKRRVIHEGEKEKILERLSVSTEMKDLKGCGLVVEAVFEDFDVKKKLFGELERHVSPECILATNTSSFSVSDLAATLQKPERFVGVHYFYHAAKNKLVELVRGEKTDPALIAHLEDFYRHYDKLPIVVKDAAGFAVNRFFVPWLNEAVRLYEEKAGTPAFIDEVARDVFNIGMGPFALMNATGVPIACHAAEGLAKKFGAFYSPAELLKKQTAAGKPWDMGASSGEKNDKVKIKDRLLAASLGVAAQMASEGVATPTATDLGARVGLRWAMGPFEMINALGIKEAKRITAALFGKWNLPMPALLEKAAGKIPLEHVASRISGTAGFIEFNRPDAMNALNEEVMAQLLQKFSELDANPAIKKIFFLGTGKAFVAGADIKFFLDNIAQKRLDRIYDFTAFGQSVFNRIAASKKTTIAYLDGLTLGGGLELALACNHRIGTERTVIAFPETGIGIYPGLGGTQRAPRLLGKGLAKFLIATGKMINAGTAKSYGVIDVVIDRVRQPDELEAVKLTSCKCANDLPEQQFSTFAGDMTPEIMQSEFFRQHEKSLKSKAPLALKKAMTLIDMGESLGLDAALRLELDSLEWIFSTEDARRGLQSVLKRERPVFAGA